MAPGLQRMAALARRFAADEAGATAIEYSMIAAGVAGAVIMAIYSLGTAVKATFFERLIGAWGG